MARTGTNLDTETANGLTNETTRTTATSISTVSGRRYFFALATGGGSGGLLTNPTVVFNGSGLTMTIVIREKNDAASSTLCLFSGVATASSSGTFTLTRGGSDTWGRICIIVDEINDSVGTAGAIQQSKVNEDNTSATSTLTCTFDGAFQSGSYGYAAFINSSLLVVTPRTNWTELADIGNATAEQLATQYRDATDTAASGSWASNALSVGVGVEVLEGAASGIPAGVLAAILDEEG